MSHWVTFVSTCPIARCPEPKRVISWVHGDDNSFQDINEEGYVKCRKNGCSMNSYPCFILNLLFKCEYHPNYQQARKMEIFNALSIVSSGNLGLSTAEAKYLLNKLLNY